MSNDRDDPGFWRKVIAAWPRKKRGPWENFTYTVADVAGEAIGKTIVNTAEAACRHGRAMLDAPPVSPPLPDPFEDADRLVVEARRIFGQLTEIAPEDKAFILRVLELYMTRCITEGLDPLHPAVLVPIRDALPGIFLALPLDVDDGTFAAAPLQGLEGARARDTLRAFIATFADPARVMAALETSAAELLYQLTRTVPPIATRPIADADDPVSFVSTVPLLDILPNPAGTLSGLLVPFYLPAFAETPYFADLRRQIDRNVHTVSRLPYPSPDTHKQIHPHKFDGTRRELADGYLADTWLKPIFDIAVPFDLTAYKRHHWSIYGRTGHGKTQLLQSLILAHLNEPEPQAVIVIDSQGKEGMLRKIEQLLLFEADPDRLLVVDAEADPSPALNMFDVPQLDESAEIDVIDLYGYIFSAIDADLTSRQSTAFSYIVRLMLAHPGATIMTLLELMEERVKTPETSKFWPTIATLDPVARSYFTNRFFTAATNQTKEQLATRLYGVLRIKAIGRMFTAQQNRLNLFQAMQERKVVFINTAGLGEASSLFGRYMIALAMRAAFQRASLPENERNPVLLFVDEAFDVMDSNINRILIQARKFGLFIRFATQQYDQIAQDIRAAAAANTEVKLAGGLSASDCRTLAPDMRTTSDYLMSTTRKDRSHTEFATFVQNVTPTAIKVRIPYGQLENAPRMDDADYEAQRMARRVSLGALVTVPDESSSPAAVQTQAPESLPPPASTRPGDPTEPADW